MTVGSKIKFLRKKRGMTQSALAENIVSRSMLSRIESGSAEPSMSSLKALAERLDISPGFLLEDSEDLLPAERALYTKQLFDSFGKGKFEECIELFLKTELFKNDSFSGMYSFCAFSVAVNAFFIGDFSAAREMLSVTETVLPSLHLPISFGTPKQISFLRIVMDNIHDLENLPQLIDAEPDFYFQPAFFVFLLKLLKDGRHADCGLFLEFCSLESVYSDFVKAQMLIKDYKFIDALLLLKNIPADATAPVFLKLLCYSSIENCCKICEDYKGAYENHIKYSELLSSIK